MGEEEEGGEGVAEVLEEEDIKDLGNGKRSRFVT